MKNYNLFGGGFQHVKSSTLNKKSKNITWNYNSIVYKDTFYVDKAIIQGILDNISKTKFGLIIESNYIIPGVVDFCVNNLKELKKSYKYIFTHDTRLIALDSKLFKFAPANGTWITKPKIYKKSKLVSMISSSKNFTLGHKTRIDFINKNKNQFDLFGRGFKQIKNKEEGLKDYMFSICIENGIYDSYFTEKILDCFACGTIPIYLGSKIIDKYFDGAGIIKLDNNFNFKNLNEKLYYDKIENIKNNFNLIENYYTVEDYIFNKYLKYEI